VVRRGVCSIDGGTWESAPLGGTIELRDLKVPGSAPAVSGDTGPASSPPSPPSGDAPAQEGERLVFTAEGYSYEYVRLLGRIGRGGELPGDDWLPSLPALIHG